MKKVRLTEEQIIRVLKEAEAGTKTPLRRLGCTQDTLPCLSRKFPFA